MNDRKRQKDSCHDPRSPFVPVHLESRYKKLNTTLSGRPLGSIDSVNASKSGIF
jgi:hypothetical protein